MLHDKLTADDPALRKAYFKMIVGQVALDNDQITIMESKAALEHALLQRDQAPLWTVSLVIGNSGADFKGEHRVRSIDFRPIFEL